MAQQPAPDSQPATRTAAAQPTSAYTPPPENYAKAVAYSHARYRHYFVNAFYGFVVLLVILAWRLAPKYRDWAERVARRRFLQAIIFTLLLILTISLFSLPTDIWDHWLSRSYGLAVQSWGSYFSDWAKSQIILWVVAIVLVLILYAVVRRSPRRWWFYFWLASIPVIVFILFLEPMVIEPLFYQFKPLQASHPELVEKLEEVVQRGGMSIPPQRMYEMNASSKTTTLNAYVAGFGASKRVVVYDTLLAKSDTAGILLVFGHEMGHYVLHHVPKELAIDCGVLLVLFYVGFLLANWILRRWGARWGVRDIADWASLPVLLLALSIVGFASDPIFNVISRHFEHEADRYGMEVIHGIVPNENQVAVRYFQMSGEVNLADPNPNPLIEFWLYDHPSRPERIAFVSSYNPWAEGKSPKYVK
ncbi:MAG TPA: M48 family metallopeptidase [Terriglobales bacterium]|nr:M48 family metallopeptidase [Terriglobales bacterium]